jgi:hypothetical protein
MIDWLGCLFVTPEPLVVSAQAYQYWMTPSVKIYISVALQVETKLHLAP